MVGWSDGRQPWSSEKPQGHHRNHVVENEGLGAQGADGNLLELEWRESQKESELTGAGLSLPGEPATWRLK